MNDFHSKRTERRKNIPIFHNHFGNEEKITLVGLRFIDRRASKPMPTKTADSVAELRFFRLRNGDRNAASKALIEQKLIVMPPGMAIPGSKAIFFCRKADAGKGSCFRQGFVGWRILGFGEFWRLNKRSETA